MSTVCTFSCHMQYVSWISVISSHPMRDVLSKAATHMGYIANSVNFTQFFEPLVLPISHWHHNGLLEHLEALLLSEMETSFPCIPKSIRPFAWIAVLFMPDIFFSPKPALFPHLKNKF